MLRFLLLTILSLLCHDSCFGGSVNTVGSPQELGWQAWLLVDTETPRPNNEEGKKRRITPKSVFIAPAFTGTSHLPDCAEGYRPDSMGRCVKLVQLNHAAQLEFLLQRLNAMYAAPFVRHDDDLSTSDSTSTGPLQVSLPIDTPPGPEDETEESVEVAIVMADVLKSDQLKKNKKNETDNSQTVVAVLNIGKNETSREEIETSSDFEMGSGNFHLEDKDSQLATSNATKYEIINKNENSTTPKASLSSVEDEQPLLTSITPTTLSEDSRPERIKAPDTAMGLLEEVCNISSEDGRSGNTSRRNVSADQKAKKETTTEMATITVEAVIANATETVQNRDPAQSVYVLQSEVPVTSETKTDVLPTSTFKSSTFVRFPAERNVGNNNVAVADKVHDDETGQLVNFSQTHFDYSRPRPVLPSDVHQRQSFWWLPPGWRLDQTRHQPMLFRFWARMPLLRDNHSEVTHNNQDMYKTRRRGPLVY